MHQHHYTMNTTNRIRSLTLILIATIMLSAPSASATSEPETHISATLQTTAIPAPGDSFLLAINLDIVEDWHTYWPGINDTGYGLTYTIDPIPGVTFGEPYFPTPSRHLAPGNILDHIYEDQIQIIIPVTTSHDIESGTDLIINTTINALVCKDVCIPESTDASITLLFTDYPVRDTNPKIAEAYNARPATLRDASTDWADDLIALNIDNASHYTFIPDTQCTQPADLITQGDTESESLTISFDRRYEDDPNAPATLSGRLRVKVIDTWHEFNVHYTQPKHQEPSP